MFNFSEWIEHDGSPCPLSVGDLVQSQNRDGTIEEYEIVPMHLGTTPFRMVIDGREGEMCSAWPWATHPGPKEMHFSHVMRYKLLHEIKNLAFELHVKEPIHG